MLLSPAFRTTLLHKTDEELFDMWVEHEDYVPEAIQLALEEFQRRGLSEDRLTEIRAGVTRRQQLRASLTRKAPHWTDGLGLLPF